MLALDTNVIVRLIVQDNPAQLEAAVRTIAEPCLVTLTVLLETSWVLRKTYKFSVDEVAQHLRDIASISTVTVEASHLLDWALDRLIAGGDLADLLHLVTARHADAFVTFDRRLRGDSGPDSPVPVQLLA